MLNKVYERILRLYRGKALNNTDSLKDKFTPLSINNTLRSN